MPALGRPGPPGPPGPAGAAGTNGTNGSGATLVTALPGSPTDGQEVFLQTAAMATAKVVWHLRYSTADAAWEFIGGAPLRSYDADSASFTADSTFRISGDSSEPILTAPVTGVYEVRAEATIGSSGASNTALGVSINGATVDASAGAAETDEFYVPSFVNAGTNQGLTLKRRVSLTAADTVALRYSSSAGTSTTYRRSIELLLVRA